MYIHSIFRTTLDDVMTLRESDQSVSTEKSIPVPLSKSSRVFKSSPAIWTVIDG